MDFLTIASGSSGNAMLVSSENTSILIDAGISMKKIEQGLNSAGRTLKDISGILITHEHIDHIGGLGVLSRKYNIPIYCTGGTIAGINTTNRIGTIDNSLYNRIDSNEDFQIGDLMVHAEPVWHDANEPCCYSICNSGKKISIATDLGDYNDNIIESIKDSDFLLIEANHDIRMLEVGPYPFKIKQRILGKYGHLSNEACGRLLLNVLNSHMKGIVLGHLSKDNNFPELAYETVKYELKDNPFTDDVRDFNLTVARRDTPSKLIQV